jgi:hypothetical protein
VGVAVVDESGVLAVAEELVFADAAAEELVFADAAGGVELEEPQAANSGTMAPATSIVRMYDRFCTVILPVDLTEHPGRWGPAVTDGGRR